MSGYRFSAEQRQAIETQGVNLLVAAGAGSGKTSVLVERLIRLVCRTEQPGSLQRTLVLTFTNAAATDMRRKIEAALIEQVRQRPGDRHLLRELHQLPQAPISTIHSFCLHLLRRYYYRLQLDGGFRIAKENEIIALQRQTLENYLAACYEENNDLICALADDYGGDRDDAALAEIISELYAFSRSQPQPEQWLRQAAALQGDRLEDFPFAAYLNRYIAAQAEQAAASLRLSRFTPEELRQYLPETWQDSLKAERALLRELAGPGLGLDERLQLLAAYAPAVWRGGKKDQNQAMRQEIKDARNAAKETLKKLQKQFAGPAADVQIADLNRAGRLMQGLAALTEGFGNMLAEEKRRRNCLDFGDMEHFAYALLQQEDIAAELRQTFDQVLVDEYQDINAVQEQILLLLQRGNNCFAVGDVKQSIYRFRLAEPHLFLDKYAAYGQEEGGKRIDLNRNYRSVASIIHGVNYIFRQLMSKTAAELDYDQAAALKAGREEQGQPPEFMLLALNGEEKPDTAAENRDPEQKPEQAQEQKPDQEQEELSAIEAEARFIAWRIRDLHSREQYAYDDMAILLRSVKNKASVLAEQLQRLGIPAQTDMAENILDSPETALFLSLLQIIDNPRQDMPLAAVLRSPLFGFTPEQLLEIRREKSGDLYQALQRQSDSDGETGLRCRDFLRRLQGWRQWAGQEPISLLMRHLWQDTGLYRLAGALSDGPRRQARLDAVYAQACAYEKSNRHGGLYRFLLWIEQLRQQGGEIPVAYGQAPSAVRIMSIHHSKGLEFPVVFVAGLGSRFHGAAPGDVIWHKDLGLGPKICQRQNRRKYPGLAYQGVALRQKQDQVAEELRIFYVALTRAKERLILSAALPDPWQALGKWSQDMPEEQVLPPAIVYDAKQPAEWFARALLRHPDGEALRRPGLCGRVLPAEGRWEIQVRPAADFPATAARETAAPLGQAPPADPLLARQVAQALGFRYPYRAACDYPAKWTVSRLNQEQQSPVLFRPSPEAAGPSSPEPAQAAARGSALHGLLQRLILQRPLAPQIAALEQSGGLPPGTIAAADIETLEAFVRSPLGKRLCASPILRREVPFTITLETGERLPPSPEHILVQGVLDAAFWEDGGWVLLDYKSGGRQKNEEQLLEQYRRQIQLYRLAIERLWRQPVKEAYLYMLDGGRIIPVPAQTPEEAMPGPLPAPPLAQP
ncbi:MAG: helicase-exonuclease AddAB subunit AddA [Firmicutes bacterium]|nr:helicase-exonuclease AddAB subunit AddA [Bacillota bacterium]